MEDHPLIIEDQRAKISHIGDKDQYQPAKITKISQVDIQL